MKPVFTALLLAIVALLAAADTTNSNDTNGIAAFNTAWNALQDSLSAKPNDSGTLLLMAYQCLGQGDLLAEQLMTRADSLAPGLLFQLANYKLARGDYESAIPLYESLNQKFPKWSCPWRHKGEALMNLHRWDESQAALEQAIIVQENHADAYVMLARVLKEKREYKQALKTLDKGLAYVKSSPEGAEEFDMAGACFLRLDLLQLTKDKKGYTAFENELRQQFPNHPYWTGEKF